MEDTYTIPAQYYMMVAASGLFILCYGYKTVGDKLSSLFLLFRANKYTENHLVLTDTMQCHHLHISSLSMTCILRIHSLIIKKFGIV